MLLTRVESWQLESNVFKRFSRYINWFWESTFSLFLALEFGIALIVPCTAFICFIALEVCDRRASFSDPAKDLHVSVVKLRAGILEEERTWAFGGLFTIASVIVETEFFMSAALLGGILRKCLSPLWSAY